MRERDDRPLPDAILRILQCPISDEPLRWMTEMELAALNRAIAAGHATDARGGSVGEALVCGLVDAGGRWCYRVSGGVAGLLPDAALPTDGAERSVAAGRFVASDASTADRWVALAQTWSNYKPPLRPDPADVAALEAIVAGAAARAPAGGTCALMLGVTPEYAAMRWPAGTHLVAVDFSPAMISHVWRAPAQTPAAVVHGNWTRMPIRDGSCRIIVGDGNFTSMAYPGEFRSYAHQVSRVLHAEGVLALRLFSRPETPAPLAGVFADLRAGRTGKASLLPWRIAMALHGDLATGVRAGAVWDAWCEHVPDSEGLFADLGWPPEAIRLVDWTRNQEYVMRFPTIAELDALFGERLERVACSVPTYEGGELYPTVAYRPRGSAGA